MKRISLTTTTMAVAFTVAAAAAQAQTPAPTGTQTRPGSSTMPTPNSTTQPNSTTRQAGDQSSPAGDKQFVEQMLMTNMAEMELGNLAQRNAASSEVKSYAQDLVKDHSKANDELQPIARQLSVQIPTKLDAKHQAVADKLSKLQGAAFDREYINSMVMGHQEALQLARSHANDMSMNRATGTSGTSATTGTTGTAGSSNASGAGTSNANRESPSPSADAHASGTPASASEYAAKVAPVIQEHLEKAQSLQKSVAK